MFKYLPLLRANLQRKPLRTALTLASIVIAFLLFGVLQALRVALTGTPDLAGVDRLITIHRVSIIQSLPLSYLNRIRGIEGVKAAGSQDWFGGIYQSERNQLGTYPVDPAVFFDIFTEYRLSDAERAAWQADRGSAIVGKALAERFGWKVGDRIPLRSNIYRKTDGTSVWDLTVAGIYTAENGDNSSLFFHYDYFNESRDIGKDSIGWVTVRIADPNRAPEIAKKIDALFANSSTETKTTTEKAFVQGFANQMGNIGALVTAVASAVFFTMLLVTANTMGQSIRERLNEIGVLQTLGFTAAGVTALVLAEALLVTAIGGIAGLLLASLIALGLGNALRQFLPYVGVPPGTYVIGALLIVTLGVLAAAQPCTQVWRLKIVDALRKA